MVSLRKWLAVSVSLAILSITTFAYSADIYYPDRKLTPGDMVNISVADLCKVGYTSTVRHVPQALAKAVFKNYGIDYAKHSQYEVDHLISLELGGSNDIKNLWPQKYCSSSTAGKTCFGAREKDVVETNLHKRICKGEITVEQAQKIIVTDWYAEYVRIKKVII